MRRADSPRPPFSATTPHSGPLHATIAAYSPGVSLAVLVTFAEPISLGPGAPTLAKWTARYQNQNWTCSVISPAGGKALLVGFNWLGPVIGAGFLDFVGNDQNVSWLSDGARVSAFHVTLPL